MDIHLSKNYTSKLKVNAVVFLLKHIRVSSGKFKVKIIAKQKHKTL